MSQWAGIRLVDRFIRYAAYRIFKPTNNAAINSVIVGLYIGAIEELGDEIEHYIDEVIYNLVASARQPIEAITIQFIGEVSGVKPKDLSKEGLLQWAGKVAAIKANESLGTNLKSMYPPSMIADEVEVIVAGAVMNGGDISGLTVFPAQEAISVLNQVAQSYNQQHGIDVTALQNREIERRKRAVAYQQEYRSTHRQIAVSLNSSSFIVNVAAQQYFDDYYNTLDRLRSI